MKTSRVREKRMKKKRSVFKILREKQKKMMMRRMDIEMSNMYDILDELALNDC